MRIPLGSRMISRTRGGNPELFARTIRLLAGSGGIGCILSAEAGTFFDSRMINRNGATEMRGRESFSSMSERLSLSPARSLSRTKTPGPLCSQAKSVLSSLRHPSDD